MNAGGSTLLVDPNGGDSTSLTLGTLSLAGATLGRSLTIGTSVGAGSGAVTITTTTNKDASGIYGGRIVFASGTAHTGYDWATTASVASPYALASYGGYSALDTAAGTDTLNSRVTASSSLSGARTTNSLKIEDPAAGQSLDLGANALTLTSGGLLVTGTNAVQIAGAAGNQLTAGNGSGAYELLVHQFNSGGLEIGASIGNNGANVTALTKSGPGALTLSGANTFTGGLLINSGEVRLGSSGALNGTAGSENAVTLSDAAILSLNGNSVVVRSLAAAANSTTVSTIVQNASATPAALTVGNSGNASTTYDGTIQDGAGGGALSLVKVGTGVLTLNGSSTYSGGTTISGGALAWTRATSLGSGTLTVTANSSLRPTSDLLENRPIVLNNGAIASFDSIVSRLVPYINTGAVSGDGGITVVGLGNGDNRIVLDSPANTFTGPIAISVTPGVDNATQLEVASLADSASPITMTVRPTTNPFTTMFGLSAGAVAPLVLNNRQLVIDGVTPTSSSNYPQIINLNTNPANTFTINTDLSVVDAAGKGIVFSGVNAGNNTFGGVISDGSNSAGFGVLKSNVGKWVLSGSNTYTGATSVSGGTLAITGSNTGGGAVTVSAGSLDLGHGGSTGSLPSTTALTLSGSGSFSFTRTDNATQSFATTAITSAQAAITVNAGNTVNLGTVSRGTFGAGFQDFAVTGPGTVAAGTDSNVGGIMPGFTYGNSWAVANGPGVAISGLASYTLSSQAGSTGTNYDTQNIDVDDSPGALDAVITANSLRFSEAAANTLSLAAGTNTVTTGGIMVTSDVGSNLSTITGGALTGSGTIGSSGRALSIIQNNTAGGLTISSAIADNGGATGLGKLGAGLLTLAGENTYTGGTTVTGGTLVVGATSRIVGNNITVGSGASLLVSGSITGSFNTVQSGGRLVVNADGGITSTNNTVQSGGTMVVNGSLNGGSVSSGGTLMGSGTVTTLGVTGKLAPGNSIDSLSIGTLTFNNGSSFEMEIDSDAAPSLAGDAVNITNALTLAGGGSLSQYTSLQLVELGSGSWNLGDKLTLFSYNGTWTSSRRFSFDGTALSNNDTISFSNADWLFKYNDTSAGTNFLGDLTGTTFVTMEVVAVVPEPGAVLLAGFGLLVGLGLPALRRRRRAGANRA